jgi:hypothetical protein
MQIVEYCFTGTNSVVRFAGKANVTHSIRRILRLRHVHFVNISLLLSSNVWYNGSRVADPRPADEQGAETMAADKAAISHGLYMTEEQYLALNEATDGNYEFYDGYVVMLSPPSSAYDEHAIIDMAGRSIAHSALCATTFIQM